MRYYRYSDGYSRISNRISKKTLDSKLYAKRKALRLLSEHNMLTTTRERMITAHFLNISWHYQLIGEPDASQSTWKRAYNEGMVSRWDYLLGKSFVNLRTHRWIKDSYWLSGITRKAHQWLMSRFLLKI